MRIKTYLNVDKIFKGDVILYGCIRSEYTCGDLVKKTNNFTYRPILLKFVSIFNLKVCEANISISEITAFLDYSCGKPNT